MGNLWIPVLVLFIVALGFAVTTVFGTAFLGPKRANAIKMSAYECGIEATPQHLGGKRIPIRYFLTAMLFIVFDIEIIFMVPWAIAYKSFVGIFGFIEMGLFILTVFIAYAYVWRRGGLEWD